MQLLLLEELLLLQHQLLLAVLMLEELLMLEEQERGLGRRERAHARGLWGRPLLRGRIGEQLGEQGVVPGDKQRCPGKGCKNSQAGAEKAEVEEDEGWQPQLLRARWRLPPAAAAAAAPRGWLRRRAAAAAAA